MARNKSTEIELTAYDDLFQTDESREEAKLSKIRDIPISEIDEFPDHPFKVLIDEDIRHIRRVQFAVFQIPNASSIQKIRYLQDKIDNLPAIPNLNVAKGNCIFQF